MALTTTNLAVGYPGRPVLSGLDLTLEESSLTVLIGANGSGKSTLLRTLTAAQPALGGQIDIDGTPLRSLSPAKLARRLSLVLTDRTGGGGLRVDELVAIGRHPYSGFFGSLTAADRQAVAEAVESVGLGHKAADFVSSLSDGERQKAMIARAIAQDTPIIVLDEPTSFLDVAARFEIIELLARMSRRGKTILLSTHDTAAAIPSASHIWTIAGGDLHAGSRSQIVESGILDSVFASARFDAATLDFRPR